MLLTQATSCASAARLEWTLRQCRGVLRTVLPWAGYGARRNRCGGWAARHVRCQRLPGRRDTGCACAHKEPLRTTSDEAAHNGTSAPEGGDAAHVQLGRGRMNHAPASGHGMTAEETLTRHVPPQDDRPLNASIPSPLLETVTAQERHAPLTSHATKVVLTEKPCAPLLRDLTARRWRRNVSSHAHDTDG